MISNFIKIKYLETSGILPFLSNDNYKNNFPATYRAHEHSFWNEAGPYVACSPCPPPTFCLWKIFGQRISLIRGNTETKESSSKRLNQSSLVIKQSQGPLVPLQGLIDNILSHIRWAVL